MERKMEIDRCWFVIYLYCCWILGSLTACLLVILDTGSYHASVSVVLFGFCELVIILQKAKKKKKEFIIAPIVSLW